MKGCSSSPCVGRRGTESPRGLIGPLANWLPRATSVTPNYPLIRGATLITRTTLPHPPNPPHTTLTHTTVDEFVFQMRQLQNGRKLN